MRKRYTVNYQGRTLVTACPPHAVWWAIEMYRAGKNIAWIAEQIDVSPPVVQKLFKVLNVPVHYEYGRYRISQVREALQLVREGYSYCAVEQRTGVKHHTVGKWVRKEKGSVRALRASA